MNFIYQKNISLAFVIMLTTFSTYAAAPVEGPPPPTPPPPPGVPIDGSIIILFLIAILYGLFSLRRSQINIKQ